MIHFIFSSTSKPHPNFKVGDFVTLQLMCREKGSLKVNKVSKMKREGFPHISGDADEILHSKLVLADPKEVSKENFVSAHEETALVGN